MKFPTDGLRVLHYIVYQRAVVGWTQEWDTQHRSDYGVLQIFDVEFAYLVIMVSITRCTSSSYSKGIFFISMNFHKDAHGSQLGDAKSVQMNNIGLRLHKYLIGMWAILPLCRYLFSSPLLPNFCNDHISFYFFLITYICLLLPYHIFFYSLVFCLSLLSSSPSAGSHPQHFNSFSQVLKDN